MNRKTHTFSERTLIDRKRTESSACLGCSAGELHGSGDLYCFAFEGCRIQAGITRDVSGVDPMTA